MEHYFLNNQPVQPPLGVDGLTLHKERNPRYFSVLFQKTGYANGVGNVTFWDESSKQILLDSYRTSGIEGDTRFTIQRDGLTLYDAHVDYQMAVFTASGITTSFHDGLIMSTLEANFVTRYPVTLSTPCTLNPKRLFGTATHRITTGRNTLQRATQSPQRPDHSLPLSKPEKIDNAPPGSFLDVSDPYAPAPAPIYRNTTAERVNLRVSGMVNLSNASASYALTTTLTLGVYNGSNARLSVIDCGTVAITTSPGPLVIVVNAVVSVEPGGWLALSWVSPTDVTRWSFTYHADSYISLEADTSTAPASVVPGVRVGELMRELIAQAGDGQYTLSSPFLDSLPLWVTDGYALANQSRGVLYANIQDVFDGLNALYNLTLSIAGNTVFVGQKAPFLDSLGTARIASNRITACSLRPWLDYQFGAVLGGYSVDTTKDAPTLTNSDEINGSRRWQTTRKGVRETLDIQCRTFTASAVQIENLRLRGLAGNTQKTAISDADLSKLFLIATTLDSSGQLTNEGLQGLSYLSNMTDTETPYNLRISPGRSLSNWLDLFPLPGLTLAESTGNSLVISRLNTETVDLAEAVAIPSISPRFAAEQVELTASMDLNDWVDLTDWIEFPDPISNVYRRGLFMSATWRETDDSGGLCTLTLLV